MPARYVHLPEKSCKKPRLKVSELMPEFGMAARAYNVAVVFLEEYARLKDTDTKLIAKNRIRRMVRQRLGLPPLCDLKSNERTKDIINNGSAIGAHGLGLEVVQYGHESWRLIPLKASNATKCRRFIAEFGKPNPEILL